jgi:hypothetical protein
MLEATKPASTGATTGSLRSATGSRSSAGNGAGRTTGAIGSRSSRRKRGLLRRTGIVLPAFAVAILLVGIVTVVAYVKNSSNGSGANSLAEAIGGLSKSSSVALLEQERQAIIMMNAAAKTLTVASKPATVDPSQVIASLQDQSGSAGTGGSAVSSGSTVSAPAPNPGTAQHTGYEMLPQFGFNQTTQWTCLLNLWNRESGWEYDALNAASGAYGIPQALPGYKMASAGADWQTDPATQIKWGLGYIKQVYGTPCGAWNNELAYGYY